MWDWVIDKQDEMGWDSLTRARHYGTPVVGETADWLINSDVRSSRLDKDDIKKCLQSLKSKEDGGVVMEGQYGGGAGMTCHQFSGGTGQFCSIPYVSPTSDIRLLNRHCKQNRQSRQ